MRLRFAYLLLLALVFTASFAIEDNDALADDPEDQQFELIDVDEDFKITEDEGEDSSRNLQSYKNIRMYAHYGALSSAPSSFRTYMQNVLGPAVLSFFEGALKIKYPVNGLMKISSSKLCSITIPSVMKTGVSADYVIMFDSALDTSSSWVAESYTCSLASGTKRPLVANTTLNRDKFKNPGSDVLLHEKNIYLMLHEMTHTLGFSNSLYKYYLMPTGKVRTGHILTKSTSLGNAKVINVPAITDRLRKFFNCPTLAGAYMENTGSSATAGSHFERRMFPFEVMTSGLIYQQSYSEFTLAMLESTGWYVPDYSFADPYWFGQGEGCNFLTQSCTASSFKFDDFCKGSSRGCTVQGRGGGNCGSDTRADGCRFIRPNVNLDCDNPSYKAPRLGSIQSYGRSAHSKCFTGSLSSTSSSAATTNFCFKFTCSGSGSSAKLSVQVGTRSVACSKAGKVSVTGYKGTINCPDPVEFCKTVGSPVCPRGCMGRGSCNNGKCVCKKGFTGKDCGLNA